MNSEQEAKPLLQIFHITDLHFIDDYDDVSQLIAERRRFTLLLRRIFESCDAKRMHEGTLGHEDTAVSAFSRLLGAMRKQEKSWFPDGNQDGPQTWIVDTGDATTFGDDRSLSLAHKSLNDWRSILGPARLLSVVGNHDLWPGTQPGAALFDDFASRMGVQRGRIEAYDIWNDMGQLSPLVASSGFGLSIELYSADTLSYDVKGGFLARGEISETARMRLLDAVAERGKPGALRILASHHPFAFPFQPTLLPPSLQQMVLANPESIATLVHPHNADEPLIHIFLGGHTHIGMPGCPLPGHVRDLQQGCLNERQLQLVAGPLLQQSTDIVADASDSGLKSHPDFSDVSQIKGSQQFQLLRFYERQDKEELVLELERIPFVRLTTEEDYVPLAELAGITELCRRKLS